LKEENPTDEEYGSSCGRIRMSEGFASSVLAAGSEAINDPENAMFMGHEDRAIRSAGAHG
jgi:hypothetical protein